MSFVNNEAASNGGKNSPRCYLYKTVVFVALDELDAYASGFEVQIHQSNARAGIVDDTRG